MQELKLRFFDEIAGEEVRWLWKPYIAFGKITVIQGDPGNGKTTLALAIAALISRREKMPTGDAPTFIGNVIYQSGEDNPQDTLKPRLAACGADCSKIACIEADGSLSPKMLEDAIVETNTKFVVLDPLQAFLTGKQDISSAKDMRPFLNELREVAARTGAAIVIVGHMNKGERSKSIYRGLGSIDITAQARSVLLVGKRKNDPGIRFMTQIKNNLSAFGKAVSFTINEDGEVEFLGESDVQEDDLLTNAKSKTPKFDIAKDLIMSMLENEDRRSNEIYDACIAAGVSTTMMQHVKKKLGIKSVNKLNDFYWTLSPATEDLDGDDIPDVELESGDETPVNFADNFCIPIGPEASAPEKQPVTMPSPFGVLTLIDWRASVSQGGFS